MRLRFMDSLGFLTVSSVTANISLSATGAVDAGFGSPASYEGNLVPLSGMLTTEENPRISYTAVPGDRFVRQLMGETPSVFHFMQLAAASIELPADLLASARQYPESAQAGTGIRIRSAATRRPQIRTR